MVNSRNVDDLLPYVAYLTKILIEKCNLAGLPILITSTYRDKEWQDDLFAKGRTKKGMKVTSLKGGQSPHQYKVAFDFCKNIKGQEYNDLDFFLKVGTIAEELGFRWGGHFKTNTDRPHIEYLGGLTYQDLYNGKQPEDLRTHKIEIKMDTKGEIMEQVKDYQKDAIEFVKAKGFMSGYSADNFGANDNITRGDFAVVVKKIIESIEKAKITLDI